jgi:hypothetical protein
VTMTSLVTLLWFFLSEATQSWSDGPAFSISLGIYACLLWFLFSGFSPILNFWRITQWGAIGMPCDGSRFALQVIPLVERWQQWLSYIRCFSSM